MRCWGKHLALRWWSRWGQTWLDSKSEQSGFLDDERGRARANQGWIRLVPWWSGSFWSCGRNCWCDDTLECTRDEASHRSKCFPGSNRAEGFQCIVMTGSPAIPPLLLSLLAAQVLKCSHWTCSLWSHSCENLPRYAESNALYFQIVIVLILAHAAVSGLASGLRNQLN